jgi:MULE transposase domain/SWIM zinc finger
MELPTDDSTARALQKEIAETVREQYITQWSTPINVDASLFGQSIATLDICDYLGVGTLWNGVIVRFCGVNYPADKNGVNKLRVYLEKAAQQSGLDIVCRTSSERAIGMGKECMSLVCACSLAYVPKKPNKDDDKENEERGIDSAKRNGKADESGYKRTLLHNARKANRKDGKTGARRRDTKRRSDSSNLRCPFLIPVYSDADGFYLKGGNGCPHHCYHSRLNPASLPLSCSSRLLLEEDRQFLHDANKARAGHTANRNLFYVRGGKFLSVDQCRRICDTTSKSSIRDEDYDVTEAFRDFFKEKKANCFFLYHRQAGLLSELHDGSAETVTGVSFDPCNFSDDDVRRTELYATKSRCGLGLQSTQDLMLALAWVLPFEKRQFSLFPFVIHLDSTNATNMENRPLFTITGRDSHGKQFTVLRALIPNECSWIFKWLFQTVMPELLGKSALKRVVLAITDGDWNEIAQLDDAIRVCIPNSMRGRCIWHIIDRGMNASSRHYPSFHTRQRKGNHDFARFESLKFTVRRWMWSWAEHHCETEDEFLLSKALFCAYLKRKEVGLMLDPTGKSSDDAVESIFHFLRGHVEPHEQHFLFYLRKHILAFEANSNSAHEGTNHGMKSHSSSTNPQQSIHEAAKTLCFQAEVKEQSTKNCLVRKADSTKLWSTLPTADKLTDFGEGLLQEQWKASANYKIHGPEGNKWLLLFDHWRKELVDSPRSAVTVDLPQSARTIPSFWRVRVVQLCETTKELTCSCFYFERVGIPCRHILSVMRAVHATGFAGVTENDVRVFWRKRYYNCAVDIGIEEDNVLLREKYLKLLENDTRGPRLDVNLATVPILVDHDVQQRSMLPIHDRCLNYSKELCRQVLPLDETSGVPANLTQESVFHNVDDDWDLPTVEHPSPSPETRPQKRAFGEMNPICQQFIGLVSANETNERVDYAVEVLHEAMAKYVQKMGFNPPVGQVVSSCIAKSKRRCTHGTDHRKVW